MIRNLVKTFLLTELSKGLRLSVLGARGLAARFSASHFDGVVVVVGFGDLKRLEGLSLKDVRCEMEAVS